MFSTFGASRQTFLASALLRRQPRSGPALRQSSFPVLFLSFSLVLICLVLYSFLLHVHKKGTESIGKNFLNSPR